MRRRPPRRCDEKYHPLECPECRSVWIVEVSDKGRRLRVWKERGACGCSYCRSRLEGLAERPDVLRVA